MCWSFLLHVRFLILLTVFELLPKICNFTICSIFSNSGHVGWCTASPDTNLKLETLVMIQTKFGFHWSSTFRGEDLWKRLRRTKDDDDGRQVMAIATAPGLPPKYSQKWGAIWKIAYLRWGHHEEVCNFHMIYIIWLKI